MIWSTTVDPYTAYYDYEGGHMVFDESPKYKTLKTVGWVFVGAGLAASISGEVLIGMARHDLAKKIGTFKVAAGPDGVGVKYSLPVKN